MTEYNIIIYVEGNKEIVLPVKYDSDYNLRKDVTNIGINGILQKLENLNYLYFPPHKINKIEVITI